MRQTAVENNDSMSQGLKAYNRWFGRSNVVLAWLALAVAVVHPPHGLRLPVCWLQATPGVPCPGCGLTRSLSCSVRGMFSTAWSYHPFGVIFTVVFLTIAVVSVLPRSWRRRMAAAVYRSPTRANTAYALFVASFLGFGLVRVVVHVLERWG